MLRIALSHLRDRGVRLETHEAVALARELLAHACGIPTPENIQLGSEGSASCISSNGMPTVASVADLLQTLLPAGTSNVPAPLRYAIARGLQAVEAPPFGSLTEFSNALARFEKGASREVLRGLLQRAARPSRAIAAAPPMFRSFGGDGEADSPGHSPRWWALAAVAAIVASFAIGFAVMDGIIHRRAATEPARIPGVAHEIRATNANAFSPAFASDLLPSSTLPQRLGRLNP